jgi:hypothetical protein
VSNPDWTPARWVVAGEQFARNTANHRMTVLHDDGLYRHIRFERPDSSFYWFSLVTWPGYLAFVGDGNGFVFSRTPDMFEFFRGKYINPDYWAEKIRDGRDRVKTFSDSKFRQLVTEYVTEQADQWPGLLAAVKADILDEDLYGDETWARDLIESWGFTPAGGTARFRFTDTQEWDFRDYDPWYLWACHAIQWGIRYYDLVCPDGTA